MIGTTESLKAAGLAQLKERTPGISTESIHGRMADRTSRAHHSLVTPLVQTATYTFADTAELRAFMEAKMWGGDPAMWRKMMFFARGR